MLRQVFSATDGLSVHCQAEQLRKDRQAKLKGHPLWYKILSWDKGEPCFYSGSGCDHEYVCHLHATVITQLITVNY